jgi:hypothetical protein
MMILSEISNKPMPTVMEIMAALMAANPLGDIFFLGFNFFKNTEYGVWEGYNLNIRIYIPLL